jgi:hypothetical protein
MEYYGIWILQLFVLLVAYHRPFALVSVSVLVPLLNFLLLSLTYFLFLIHGGTLFLVPAYVLYF